MSAASDLRAFPFGSATAQAAALAAGKVSRVEFVR